MVCLTKHLSVMVQLVQGTDRGREAREAWMASNDSERSVAAPADGWELETGDG